MIGVAAALVRAAKSAPAIIVASTKASETDTGQVVVAKPAGVVAGDLLVAGISGTSDPAAPSAPAGWTQLQHNENSGANHGLTIWYKVAGGSEPANYAFVEGAASFWQHGIIVALRGAGATPIAASGIQENATASTNVTAPSISPAMGNCILLGFFAHAQNYGLTPPGSMVELQDTGATGYRAIMAAWETLAASGATGTRVATISPGQTSRAALVAVAPS